MNKNITHYEQYIDSSPLDTLNFNDTEKSHLINPMDNFLNIKASQSIKQIDSSPLDTLNFNNTDTEIDNNIFVNTEEGFFDNPRSKNDKLKVNKKKFNNPTSYSNTSIQSTEQLLNKIYGGSENFENSEFSEHSSDIYLSEYSGSDLNSDDELSSSEESYSELSGGSNDDEGDDDDDDDDDDNDDDDDDDDEGDDED